MDCASYNMAMIIQNDATEYSLFKSQLLNTFRVVFHPSSEANNTVSTLHSGNDQPRGLVIRVSDY